MVLPGIVKVWSQSTETTTTTTTTNCVCMYALGFLMIVARHVLPPSPAFRDDLSLAFFTRFFAQA